MDHPSDAEPELQEDPTAQVTPESQDEPAEHSSPGRQAGKNGAELEHAVRSRLLRCGYAQEHALPEPRTAPFFIHHWHKSGLYSVLRTALVPDFFIWHPRKYPEGCLMECKWQERAGSAEAKIELVIKSLLATPFRAIVILCGPGFSRAYKDYYKSLENARLTVITSSDDLWVRMNRGLF